MVNYSHKSLLHKLHTAKLPSGHDCSNFSFLLQASVGIGGIVVGYAVLAGSTLYEMKCSREHAKELKEISDKVTVGQNYGEMLAETGSFDVLFWYWVLGIWYLGIYIYTYVYMYTYILSIVYWGIYIYLQGTLYICIYIYILRIEDDVILHGQSS